jgi:hypothetical protein
MKIKAKIINRILPIDLVIDTETNECIINEEKYNVNVSKLTLELFSYISNWPRELIGEKILDGEKYKIVIKTDKEIKEFVGINSFPPNYKKFKDCIHNIISNDRK